MTLEIQFQHCLFFTDGSEDFDVEAVVDFRSGVADLTSVRSTATGEAAEIDDDMRRRLERVAYDHADDVRSEP